MTPRKRQPEPDSPLRVATVARRLGVHAETVRAWIRQGKIDFIRLPDGHYRIEAAVVEALKISSQKFQ